MINREEITENIKRLLQGYADTRNDISITRRNPYEAEVYIDGKYFNTYLVKEKKFKHNIVRPADLDEEFKITVILSRDDLAETKTQYKGAKPGAFSIAALIAFKVASILMTTPFRSPVEGSSPTPATDKLPSSANSAITALTLQVPISSPTILLFKILLPSGD